jgi:hypothetical protein
VSLVSHCLFEHMHGDAVVLYVLQCSYSCESLSSMHAVLAKATEHIVS